MLAFPPSCRARPTGRAIRATPRRLERLARRPGPIDGASGAASQACDRPRGPACEARRLDHRRRERRAGHAPADGVADRLGRTEHTIEPLEVGAGLVDRRASLVGGARAARGSAAWSPSAAGRPRGERRASVSSTRSSTTTSAANPIEHSTAATTSTSSPAVTSRLRSPCGGGACVRRSSLRHRGNSARTSVDRRASRAGTAGQRFPTHGREDSRSPHRGRSMRPPGSGRHAGAPAPRRRHRLGRRSAPFQMARALRLLFGAVARWIAACDRLSCASGSPTCSSAWPPPRPPAARSCRRGRRPREAKMIMRRAMKRASSPASSIRASQ